MAEHPRNAELFLVLAQVQTGANCHAILTNRIACSHSPLPEMKMIHITVTHVAAIMKKHYFYQFHCDLHGLLLNEVEIGSANRTDVHRCEPGLRVGRDQNTCQSFIAVCGPIWEIHPL